MQSKAEAKQKWQEGVQALNWGSQDLKLLLESADTEVIIPWKLSYVSSTPPIHQTWSFFVCFVFIADGHTEIVIFCRLQGLWISKTLLYVMNHSINVSRPRYDFFSVSI
jgi:hypothetical protein